MAPQNGEEEVVESLDTYSIRRKLLDFEMKNDSTKIPRDKDQVGGRSKTRFRDGHFIGIGDGTVGSKERRK